MALVKSIQIPLGNKLSDFELCDPYGKIFHSDKHYQSANPKGVLIAFMCNHCPYAIAIWPRLIQLEEYVRKYGISVVAINPNIHPDYPEDNVEAMKDKVQEWEIKFPYLADENQTVAKMFDAQCTPDIYFFDDHKKLIYHGRFDDNWQNESKVKKQDLKEAVLNYLNGHPVSIDQTPAMGCSIKWK